MFIFPAVYVLLLCLILVEGSMPGNQSSSQSKLFAKVFDNGPKQAEIILPEKLSMDQEEYELTENTNLVLNPIFYPDNTTDKRVEYTILDGDSFLSLNGNSLQGIKEGKSHIEVKSTANPNLIFTFSVSVLKEQIHQLTGELSTDTSLMVGMTSKLSVHADVKDFSLDEIQFVSENPEVTSVQEDGILRMLKPGNSDVYAYLKINPEIRTEKTTITVIEGNFVDVASITYDSHVSMYVGEKKNIVPIFNDGCSDKAFEISQNDGYQTDKEEISATKAGTYDVKLTSVNNPEISTKFQLEVKEVRPSSIDVSFASIQYGKTEKLSYTLVSERENLPVTDPEVEFVSDNPSIATIDENGYLVGFVKGSVNITVYWKKDPAIKGTATIAITAMDGKKFDHINYIVRKLIGHFGVFLVAAVFGILTVYFFVGKDKLRYFFSFVTLVIGLVVAMLSEYLQINAGDRGPSWNDVGIDFSGYALGAIITFLICFFVILHQKRKKPSCK